MWTALYGMIGATGWRMSRRGVAPQVWVIHAAQLTLNAAWPWAFFTVRDKRLSQAIILPLNVLVGVEIAELLHRDRLAAGLLTPYLVWSLFAAALNAFVSDPARTRPA